MTLPWSPVGVRGRAASRGLGDPSCDVLSALSPSLENRVFFFFFFFRHIFWGEGEQLRVTQEVLVTEKVRCLGSVHRSQPEAAGCTDQN